MKKLSISLLALFMALGMGNALADQHMGKNDPKKEEMSKPAGTMPAPGMGKEMVPGEHMKKMDKKDDAMKKQEMKKDEMKKGSSQAY